MRVPTKKSEQPRVGHYNAPAAMVAVYFPVFTSLFFPRIVVFPVEITLIVYRTGASTNKKQYKIDF